MAVSYEKGFEVMKEIGRKKEKKKEKKIQPNHPRLNSFALDGRAFSMHQVYDLV